MRSSPPPPDPSLGESFDELSEVRPRLGNPDPEPREPSVGERPELRTERIQRKLRMAKVLLDDLPPFDERARLLQIAIVRQDEVLLDGILGALQAQRPATPIGTLASQIARRRHSSGIRPAYRESGAPAAAAQGEATRRPSTLLPPARSDDDE